MIRRVTTWLDDRGNTVQVEHAILNGWWEPLVSHALPVGPFDDPAELLALVEARSSGWYELYGEQLPLLPDL